MKGFTLIELLIVVAIIAILAAIAVPNFLEAQTRSKVSRCLADSRSLMLAVQAYRVDFNNYPLDGNDFSPVRVDRFNSWATLSQLTTPVSFITTVPLDPFHLSNGSDPALPLLTPPPAPFPFIYFTFGGFSAHSGRPEDLAFVSVGPDLDFDNLSSYDPTNGTVSNGDVYVRASGK